MRSYKSEKLLSDGIKYQQDIARLVQSIIDASPYSGILASGAPRNWNYNKLANDLDFYIKIPILPKGGNKFHALMTILNNLFGDDDSFVVDVDEYYDSKYKHPDIEYLFTFKIYGLQIQFILTYNDIDTVINNFGLTISKITWKDGQYYKHPDFIQTENDRIIRFCGIKESNNKKFHHKVLKQFKDFKAIDWNGNDVTYQMLEDLDIEKCSNSGRYNINYIEPKPIEPAEAKDMTRTLSDIFGR